MIILFICSVEDKLLFHSEVNPMNNKEKGKTITVSAFWGITWKTNRTYPHVSSHSAAPISLMLTGQCFAFCFM